jgi:DNA-3-methyladenine glycosylase I
MPKKLKTRCAWVNLDNDLYILYHDKEWGVAVHNDIKHFEMITLEGAQAGLSWETVLNKRDNYRRLFDKFSPKKVASYNKAKIEKLLKNTDIIRNRLKVESTVTNAKAFLKIQKEFGSFDKYIWNFVNHKTIVNSFKSLAEYPTKTPLSDAISKDLKKRGFRFVGSTIIYAYMQAVGLVDDHLCQCFVREKQTQDWHVYIIQTKNGELYTGISRDVQKRFTEHQSQNKKTAKYLRGKAPLKLVFKQLIGTKQQAMKKEREIKSLTKKQKTALLRLS